MASKIRVLSDLTINQIAAGEVIENPSSVVKELVENALDAGATHICVEIRGGGRQLIRVSDNGCGMSADDALLCLERHATSKIRQADDLQSLITMGFRGEAIPSIASISKFMLLTCPQPEIGQTTSSKGTMVIVEGGRLLSHAPAARAPGTTIEVKSLFFNVPVRKKFQKSPAYDTQEIHKMLSALALGHPTIQFELISDQKSLLNMPMLSSHLSFQEQLKSRIEIILGRDFLDGLCPLTFHKEPYHLEGYIGLPTSHRPNRTGQYLFINHRAVHSPLIALAIREGYGPSLASNRYPTFVLHLNVEGSLVDVNVHPQKKEVRLRQEQVLQEALIQAVQSALQAHHFIEEPPPFLSHSYEQLLSPVDALAAIPYSVRETPNTPSESESSPAVFMAQPYLSIPIGKTALKWQTAPSQESSTDPWSFFSTHSTPKANPSILTTLPGFILVDPFSLDRQSLPNWKEGFGLIDQRAAHARVHYERFLEKLAKQEHEAAVQPLLIPLTVEFSPLEASLLRESLPILNRMDFDIQEFGDHTFIIHAVPELFKKEDVASCLRTILHDLNEWQDGRHVQRERDKQLALAACRASISTRYKLSIEEAKALVNQLLNCQSPLQCPFGHPTLVFLSLEDLMKQFQS